MPLILDEPFDFLGYGRYTSRCRVRIFTPPDVARESGYVVMLVDDAGASGTPVTNAAEQICARICARYHIPPEQATFLEHYDFRDRPGQYGGCGHAETFARITSAVPSAVEEVFDYVHGSILGRPQWSHIDRDSVESLIGQALP